MEQPTAPEPGTAAPEPQMPSDAGQAQGQQASPEEQEQYNHFVAKAYELIYDRAMLPKILGMLAGEGDPVEGLARAASLVINRLVQMAEQAGDKLSGDVILHAGTGVFEDLANLAKEAKIFDFSTDQDKFEAAYFRMLDMFRTMLQESGRLDQQAAAKDLETLMQMDQGGKLEEMLRGLAEEDEQERAAPAKEKVGPRGGLMQEAE